MHVERNLVLLYFIEMLPRTVSPKAICRPFVDFKENTWTAESLNFLTDAAKSDKLGLGCIFGRHWLHKTWDGFIAEADPSIEYLELYALAVGVDLWGHEFHNKRVIIYCDNMSVVHMLNKSTANCVNCMVLIRLLVLNSLKYNFRLFARHEKGIDNVGADLLSRNKLHKFWQIYDQNTMDSNPTMIPSKLWPPQKIWRRC